jgi:hypothetical protein
MIAMYSLNSMKNGWWEAINLIIWGGSTRLAAEDSEVQKELRKLIENGVTIEACKACADNMGKAAILEELGVEVKYMRKLTQIIKGDEKLITV